MVGPRVVGPLVVGFPVVGPSVVGFFVVGLNDVGFPVVGDTVVGVIDGICDGDFVIVGARLLGVWLGTSELGVILGIPVDGLAEVGQ